MAARTRWDGSEAVKTLYLLRHAKSSWDDPSLADFDRPLSRRGRKAAKGMDQLLGLRGWRPDLVLCSSARRTRETFAALPTLAGADVAFERGLYEADQEHLLDRLRTLPDAAGSAMVIGHNPGLERLTWLLVGHGAEGPAHAALRRKFPTAAMAVLECAAARWAQLTPGSCRLVDFVRPGDVD